MFGVARATDRLVIMCLTWGDRCSLQASPFDSFLIYTDNMTFTVLAWIPRLKMAKKSAQDVSHRKWSGLETVGISEKLNTDSQVFGSWLADQSCR